MIIYELKKVKKNWGNFSLEIEKCSLEKGCIYAVIGPNGCGKSTFLNLLSLADRPSSGELFFKGNNLNCNDKEECLRVRRDISHLMQSPYLFKMSVQANVSYGLKIRGLPKDIINQKVKDVLCKLSLSHLAKKNINCLSGGEAQRVALARTLVMDSEVFLLDEPTAYVDKQNIGLVENLLLSLSQDKKSTMVIATHSQGQAYRMSKNIISIIDGKIKDIAYENVFSGILKEGADGLKILNLAKEVSFKLNYDQEGSITIAIDPQDVILSNELFNSSALNRLYGEITKLENINGSLRVFIDAGVVFCALITYKSFHDMNLNIGKKVWATFKTNSIKII